eukprot:2614373-Heterocapsa_arctica.AAC.1
MTRHNPGAAKVCLAIGSARGSAASTTTTTTTTTTAATIKHRGIGVQGYSGDLSPSPSDS